MKNIIKNVFLFVSLLPFIAVEAQEYIKQDTVYRKDGTLWRINEYIDGQMIKRTTYDKWGRKYDVTPFRNGEPFGWSEFWDFDNDSYQRCFCKGWGSPRIVDKYSVWQDQKGLSRRIVQDEGYETHSFNKPDCDSTQTDITDTHIVLRDYKEGRLRSLEQYTSDLIPDGTFEDYHPGGKIACRRLFRQGELVSEQFFDYKGEEMYDGEDNTGNMASNEPEEIEDNEPDGVKITKLTKEGYRELLTKSCDSKNLRECLDSGHDLIIRNTAGEILLERHSTEEDWKSTSEGTSGHLNSAYYGYDKNLGLHLGFSSYGDYNDVHFFVVPEKTPVSKYPESNIDYLELEAESISIHETTGYIAVICGDRTTRNYSLFCYSWNGTEFSSVFDFMLDLPVGLPDLWWIGDNSLIVSLYEGEWYRIDITPESLKPELIGEEDEGDI